ncbi:large ribosomal subunit protein bL36m [Osmerus eperlanus]|uniref:large ribosomal subunit protein bL36m n=1 Tax=Osmerus eperlanus TaxID=29151 RepID=UPI002E0F8914
MLTHLARTLSRQLTGLGRSSLCWFPHPGFLYRGLSSLSVTPRLLVPGRAPGLQAPASATFPQDRGSLLGQCQHLACLQPCAGMKTKSSLKRRCKDCFYVRRRGRLFVFCKTHPRHKQRQG